MDVLEERIKEACGCCELDKIKIYSEEKDKIILFSKTGNNKYFVGLRIYFDWEFIILLIPQTEEIKKIKLIEVENDSVSLSINDIEYVIDLKEKIATRISSKIYEYV